MAQNGSWKDKVNAALDALSDALTGLDDQTAEKVSAAIPVLRGLISAPIPEQDGHDDGLWALLTGLDESLRAPLIAIRGRAELIEGGVLGELSAEQARWVNAILSNTRRAFAILDNVHELIEWSRGDLNVKPEPVEVTEMVSEATQASAEVMLARGHTLLTRIPDGLPKVNTDFYRTMLIIADMLDNAARYTPPGGTIRLSAENMGEWVLITISDTGIGLEPDEVQMVGKPFWRGSHPLVRRQPGTGLRMAIARKVLSLLGAELFISGEPGVGSSFSFTLPVKS